MPQVVAPDVLRNINASSQLPQPADFKEVACASMMPKIVPPDTLMNIAIDIRLPEPADFGGVKYRQTMPQIVGPDTFRNVKSSAQFSIAKSSGTTARV
jgi:hypothetical protein